MIEATSTTTPRWFTSRSASPVMSSPKTPKSPKLTMPTQPPLLGLGNTGAEPTKTVALASAIKGKGRPAPDLSSLTGLPDLSILGDFAAVVADLEHLYSNPPSQAPASASAPGQPTSALPESERARSNALFARISELGKDVKAALAQQRRSLAGSRRGFQEALRTGRKIRRKLGADVEGVEKILAFQVNGKAARGDRDRDRDRGPHPSCGKPGSGAGEGASWPAHLAQLKQLERENEASMDKTETKLRDLEDMAERLETLEASFRGLMDMGWRVPGLSQPTTLSEGVPTASAVGGVFVVERGIKTSTEELEERGGREVAIPAFERGEFERLVQHGENSLWYGLEV